VGREKRKKNKGKKKKETKRINPSSFMSLKVPGVKEFHPFAVSMLKYAGTVGDIKRQNEALSGCSGTRKGA
jgi:hypothetical protein